MSSLQGICLLTISSHIYDYPVDTLAQLPIKIRKLVLTSIPSAVLHKLESTPVASEIDTSDCWTALREFFDDKRLSSNIKMKTMPYIAKSDAKSLYLNLLLNSFYQLRSQSELCRTLIRMVALPFVADCVNANQMKSCGVKVSCSCHKCCIIPPYHEDFIPGNYQVTTLDRTRLDICNPIAFFLAKIFKVYDSINAFGCEKETWKSSKFKIWQQQKDYLSQYWSTDMVKSVEIVCYTCRKVDAHESDLELITSFFTDHETPQHFESLIIDDYPENAKRILSHFTKVPHRHDDLPRHHMHTINRLSVTMRSATSCSYTIAEVIRSQKTTLHTLELAFKFRLTSEIMLEVLSLVERPGFKGLTLQNLSTTLNHVSLSKFVYSQIFPKYFSVDVPTDNHQTLFLKNIQCSKESIANVKPAWFTPNCTENRELILEGININSSMFNLLHLLSSAHLKAPLKQLQLVNCQIHLITGDKGFPRSLTASELALKHLTYTGEPLTPSDSTLNIHRLLLSPHLREIHFQFDQGVCSIDQSQGIRTIAYILTEHAEAVHAIQKISFKFCDDKENIASLRTFFDSLFSSFIDLMNGSNEDDGIDLTIYNSSTSTYELQWLYCIYSSRKCSKKFKTITCSFMDDASTIYGNVEQMCEEMSFL